MAIVLSVELRKHPAEPLTVPDWVEQKLGLEVGDALLFMMDDDVRIFLQREGPRPLDEVLGSIKTDRPFPIDAETDAAVEEAVAEHYREKNVGLVEGDERRRSSLDSIIGMFKLPSAPSDNFREERDAAWEQVARERVERMKRNTLPE